MFKSRLWFAAGAVCCLSAIYFVRFTNRQKAHKEVTIAGAKSFTKVRERRTYPYSVISGGAASGAELRTALLADAVAAEHYAGFHVERTQVVRLNRPHRFFVSYRKGDQIYWTHNRMTLPQGETVLTDGSLSARTRCGNRLSDTPQSPTLQKEEPRPEDFEEFVEPNFSLQAWKDQNWQDQQSPTRGNERTETGTTVAIDYQSTFGPNIGAYISRTSNNAGGGIGSWSGGGGPSQGGPTVPSSPPNGSTGSAVPVSGTPSFPSVPSFPPAQIQPVLHQPFTDTGTPSFPVATFWMPVTSGVPYVFPTYDEAPPGSRIFRVVSYPSVGSNQILSAAGLSRSDNAVLAIPPSKTFSPSLVDHSEVAASQSPEPGTFILIVATGIFICAAAGIGRRLRNPRFAVALSEPIAPLRVNSGTPPESRDPAGQCVR